MFAAPGQQAVSIQIPADPMQIVNGDADPEFLLAGTDAGFDVGPATRSLCSKMYDTSHG
jgi:hypothetical protein